MASITPPDILQYFHAAHTELFAKSTAQTPSLRNTQLQRLCKRAVELASDTKHSTIVKEFAQSCCGDEADEENRWLLKKTVLGTGMMPSDRQNLEKELTCFIADFGEAEVKEDPSSASTLAESERSEVKTSGKEKNQR